MSLSNYLKYFLYTASLVLFMSPMLAQTAEWETLKAKNYSIEYPSEWATDVSGQFGSEFFLFGPLESEADEFSENINLIIQDLEGMDIDLKKYTEISLEQIKSMITDGKIYTNENIKTDYAVFQKLVYTGTQGKFKLKFIQHYTIVNEKAYILTLTCEESQYDSYADIGEQILGSFQIK